MSARASIDVSVIVPMYQSGATVDETIASVLADFDASGVSGELVVVNDGSTDDGPAIAERAARCDGRVRLVHRANGGLSAARNTGLDHARGRFLRFLDADDLAVPSGLAALLACAIEHGAACGGQELIDEVGMPMGRELSPRTDEDRMVGLRPLMTGNAMGVGAVLISRETLGGERFDEALRVCEDWDLWLRLAKGGVRFAALPAWRAPVKRYRVRPGSLSKRYALMHETGARVLGRSIDLDIGAGLLRLATSYGAMQALAGDISGGLAMLRAHPPRALAAGQLAGDAFGAVLLGLGVRPERRGPERVRWVSGLSAWWASLAVAGGSGRAWTDATTTECAWRELARLTVAPGAVAAACVKQVRAIAGRSAVVVGLGKNGRCVVQALKASSLPWSVRDDGLAPGAGGAEVPEQWRPMSDAIQSDAAVIVTPERCDALVGRLRGHGIDASRMVRWDEVLTNLAVEEAADLQAAIGASAAAAGEGRRCA